MPGPYFSPLPAPFCGVDRAEFLSNGGQVMVPATKDSKEKNQLDLMREAHSRGEIWKENPFIQWMQQLYKRSNLEFTGIYLTSDPIPPHTKKDYAMPTYHVSNGWVDNLSVIEKMGWATFLIYEGFTNGNFPFNPLPKNPTIDAPGAAERYGRIHGEQIKSIVAKFGPGHVGSVVYVVNEVDAITTALEKYYQTVFDTMKTQGSELGAPPPVRPGFYARDDNSLQMLKKNPDLFVWFITGGNWKKPFKSNYPILDFDLETYSIWMYRRSTTSITLPVGDQTVMNYEGVDSEGKQKSVPPPDSPLLSESFFKTSRWDFNSCFVRDPSFPEAYPRFCARKECLVRGLWNREQRAMAVEEFIGPPRHGIDGSLVEPEAPLLLTDSMDLFTLGKDGNLLTCRQLGPQKWPKLQLFMTSVPALRRIRAICAIALGSADVQVFYIGADLNIYGIRRKGPTVQSRWTDARPIGVKAHQFSQLAVASMDGKSIDVAFMGKDRRVQVHRWDQTARTWPDGRIQTIASKTALLPGSSITLVANSKEQHRVFALNEERKLCMAFTNVDGRWSEMEAIEFMLDVARVPGMKPTPIPKRPQVYRVPIFAHTKLAAIPGDERTIQVAAINQEATPCIFTLSLSGIGRLVEAKAFPLPLYPNASPKGWPLMISGQAAMEQQKMGEWQVNPFGDVVLTNEPEGVTLICAFCAPGKVGLGRRRVNRKAEGWFRYPENAGELLMRAVTGMS